ncbi:SMC-Scp complex subunit ScpB [Clostridium massiliamazoniense]|uniref:SMC-Scp complex subunit ScpB n=1 Tax=Clostridium massiliamazoniense TaxID=1347366 RepID=UPI0006D7F49F
MNNISQIEFKEVSNKKRLFSIIESLLFVSGDPLSPIEISKAMDLPIEEVLSVLKELALNYDNEDRGINLITINGNFQLVTKNENSIFIQKLLKKNTRQSLSQASLESLAIIAYKQPITKIEIDEIRGVKSESAIQRLIEKNLIEETGRADAPGRPILYGTTDEFLRHFALGELNELPSIELFDDNNETKKESYER